MIRLALIALLVGTPAAADGMAFFLKNQHSRAAAVELYGRQGRATTRSACNPLAV